jgi:hypothetical protein
MSVLLALVMQDQSQSNWCWAAVAASVDAFLGGQGSPGVMSQCQVANAVLGQSTCCTNGGSDACNVDSYLDQALAAVGHSNGNPYQGTASFDAIRLLTSPPYSVPIGVRVSIGNDGHFLLIVGFIDDQGKQWVHTADPCYGPGTYDLSAFASAYQGAQWTYTYPIK